MKARLLAVVASVALTVSAFPVAHALFGPEEQDASETPTAAAPAARKANGNKLVWTRVSSKQPKKAFYNKKTAAPVGKTAGSVNRAYFRMTLEDAVYEDHLDSVKLVVPVTKPNPCRKGGTPKVNVHLTGGISKKTTWKNQPKTVKKLATVKATCSSKSLELNITKVAAGILNKGNYTVTLRLSAANEKSAKGFVNFSNKARLVIRASSDDAGGVGGDPGANLPTPVEGASFTPAGAAAPIACGAGATRPVIAVATGTFGGTTADPDGSFIGLRAQWKPGAAAAADANLKVALSGMQYSEPNEKRTFAFAAGDAAFAEGIYSWRVQARDDVAASAWSGWCEFEVDLPAAPGPVDPDPADPPVVPVVPAARS
ncbi:hypothetical protein EDD29_8457 [Actinocorallia herbida]|uniref:Uncharacterized protein n=1 Tax=Actinocorallia herbida TaxID=58109 RepID=A0A3N1DB40_9ACTN|nr:DNRLRE domain-containing protein [Actinocorallia herbida]ROO90719.1 hypothetical protein EDD29_8457 [Actinocorallia herbida]